jgi:hypothetical protein
LISFVASLLYRFVLVLLKVIYQRGNPAQRGALRKRRTPGGYILGSQSWFERDPTPVTEVTVVTVFGLSQNWYFAVELHRCVCEINEFDFLNQHCSKPFVAEFELLTEFWSFQRPTPPHWPRSSIRSCRIDPVIGVEL